MEAKDYSKQFNTAKKVLKYLKQRDEATFYIQANKERIQKLQKIMAESKRKNEPYYCAKIELEKSEYRLRLWESDLRDALKGLLDIEREEDGKIHA